MERPNIDEAPRTRTHDLDTAVTETFSAEKPDQQ